ncbi:MAG: VOC family protein [Alphaproteobacteria bacterium]|nr:VOC family protein [Alphaproteobacteria bacterium]
MTVLDHLLWGAADLDRGCDAVERLLGIRPKPGGVHPGLGTRNALLAFGQDTYLEVIAPDPAQDIREGVPQMLRDLRDPGLITWCARGAVLAELPAKLAGLPVTCSGVIAMARQRPDGGTLRWQVLRLSDHGLGAVVPFFIDWMDSPHPARALPDAGRLASVSVTHPEPQRVDALYAAVGLKERVARAAPPSLTAEVETPKGRVRLEPAVPFPTAWRR